MPARQLRLFPPARPLEDRLGREFFRALPPRPGVYTMRCAAGRILYIGQSANLRARLSYYRGARPESAPRKVIRLVHQTDVIEWVCCETVEEAMRREEELIRRHRPKFNVALTWPVTSFDIGVAWDGRLFRCRMTDAADSEGGEVRFGPFRGRMWGRRVLRALARASWCCWNRPTHCWVLPHSSAWGKAGCQILCRPDQAETVTDWHWPWLIEFLGGTNPRWLERLGLELAIPRESCALLRQLIEDDLEVLGDYFDRTPVVRIRKQR